METEWRGLFDIRSFALAPAHAAALVGTTPLHHRRPGADQDGRVEPERPILDVPQVQPDGLIPRQIRPPTDLPEAGQPGPDEEPSADVLGVTGNLARQGRPRSHE